jgi:Protein of unknown function (DUF3501)
MRPLTLDDLLPLDEYADRRGEFFESLGRYLDRYRRVRIGPVLTLLFENRQTLWFRLHEVIRVARLSELPLVQQELDLYNLLLPARNRLHAALLIEVSPTERLTEQLLPWRALHGDELVFHLGGRVFFADVVTARPEDRCIGAAHWVQFTLDAEGRRRLADFRLPAYFEVRRPNYPHEGPPLSDEVRQSLLDDLESSDRD